MTEPDVAPAIHNAPSPPEARGLARDAVRLLVASPDGIRHTTFARLPDFLHEGDLVVVNTSATLAAAVDGHRADGGPVTVHFSTRCADHVWLVEIRHRDRRPGPVPDARTGERLGLPGGLVLELRQRQGRLWAVAPAVDGGLDLYLSRYGRPITYSYLDGRYPLAAYQTVFAREPGSAEMPSAGRPFSTQVVTALVRAGVAVTPLVLHTGVSSLERGEPPLPERYRVPAATARLVNVTRASGGRVVAAGTTVTRALESAVATDGAVAPAEGWTDLVLGPERPARVVDGLITGWHEAGASHLRLLEAVAGADLVAAAYAHASGAGYLWHEFGDSCLLLPGR